MKRKRLPKGIKCYLKEDIKILGIFEHLDLYVHKGCPVEIIGDNRKGHYEILVLDGLHNGTEIDDITYEQLEPCAYSLGILIRGLAGTVDVLEIEDDETLYKTQILQFAHEFTLDMNRIIQENKLMNKKFGILNDVLNKFQETMDSKR